MPKEFLHLVKKRRCSIENGFVEKYRFRLKDGEHIESALRVRGKDAELYLSCQVGCGIGCQFCECSVEWLIRDLSWKEIFAQVDKIFGEKCNNSLRITFNGIGEPTNNEKEVTKAISKILKKYPQSNIKITTTGANHKALKKWLKFPISLQLSLHAPTSDLREKIIETIMDVDKIIKAARNFAKAKREKVAVNFLLLKNFNDSYEVIDSLLKKLNPRYFSIIFSKLNPAFGQKFSYEPSEKFDQMSEYVASRGFEVAEFEDIGQEIDAACGQLRA
ncbi:MAG: hypothetical protein ACD_63C00014G0004 [uncultured bacterium]|nr:MAG: hypothetical protein ACD_63C00014G0004 [uncultured bacterium]